MRAKHQGTQGIDDETQWSVEKITAKGKTIGEKGLGGVTTSWGSFDGKKK